MVTFLSGASFSLRRGDAARDKRNWVRAAEHYQAYLEQKPHQSHIWVQLGNCHKEAGDYTLSLDAYGQALALMPDNVDLHIQLGHLAKLDGRKEDAIASYSRAVELDLDNQDARQNLEQLNAGIAYQTLLNKGRYQQQNDDEARQNPDAVEHSRQVLEKFRRDLPKLDGNSDDSLMPKALHFVFGFKQKGDLPYYACMAIRSALHFNPGWKAYYYTMHVPEGPNWATVVSDIEVILLDDFHYYGNSRLYHYAHKADIVRMIVLNEVGGAYLDIDSITQRSFEDLRKHEFVMGVQAAGAESSSGLCNAIMFGKPKARFSTRWLGEYNYFRSKGRDDLWDFHSVKLPVHLATQYPDEINVLDYRALFYPLWGNIKKAMFSETSAIYKPDFAVAYCFHLWNGATGEWLEEVDLDFVRSSHSYYAMIARKVEGLPSPSDATL